MRTVPAHFAFVLLLTIQFALSQDSSKPLSFRVPTQLVALSQLISPGEYTALIAAIRKEIAGPEVSRMMDEGLDPGDLNWITAVRVPLGSLHGAVMVNFGHSPSCGTGGCPMWLFVRDAEGYRSLIRAGGWGFSLQPSGGPVPDIAFYWQMGAGETDVSQFRFAKGKFVRMAAHPAKCGGEDDTRGVCAGRASQRWNWAITPAEYDSLQRELQPASGPLPASQSALFKDAHAVDFPLVGETIARVVGLGNCTSESDCRISIYGCKQTYPAGPSAERPANIPDCQYWPMLRDVGGWGVTSLGDVSGDVFSPQFAFAVAQYRSGHEMELRRYSVVTKSAGPQPGSKLSPDGCLIVTPKTGNWAAEWDPAAIVASPKPCR